MVAIWREDIECGEQRVRKMRIRVIRSRLARNVAIPCTRFAVTKIRGGDDRRTRGFSERGDRGLNSQDNELNESSKDGQEDQTRPRGIREGSTKISPHYSERKTQGGTAVVRAMAPELPVEVRTR
jgi:hypothetical protein